MPRLRKKEIYVLYIHPVVTEIRKVIRISDTYRGVEYGEIGVEFVNIINNGSAFATLGYITESGCYYIVTKEQAQLLKEQAQPLAFTNLANMHQYTTQILTEEYVLQNLPHIGQE